MTERWERFRQFPFHLPVLNAALIAGTLRWLMLLIGVAGLLSLLFKYVRQRQEGSTQQQSE
jgi:hypothetical protein